MPKQFKPQLTIQEEMNINKTTISEITKMMWDSDNEIENLKGKQFVFQIQLNGYNLKYGWDFYTVKKRFDSFEETDKVIQLDKMTKAYISDASNECSNNLSTEEDGDCTIFQKLEVQSNVQLTPTSILKENKRPYSETTTKQQRKKIQKTL
ncbi:uncharacterized protein LOC142643681 isoform X3 [Castanea sativa]|uniref:uncharacterized protein LOC142643681 isoform X3 n=1 Tax=Castanea sativa TaxID=21020 RepID=UPI003F64EB08